MSYDLYRYNAKPIKKKRLWLKIPLVVLLMVFTVVWVQDTLQESPGVLDQTTKDTKAVSLVDEINLDLNPSPISPTWPEEMQSAVGAIGYGVLAESNPGAEPVEMASLAKVMAAILVIEKESIGVGEPGRDLVFNLQDEVLYNKYLFEGGVVTTIKAGETIPLREALDAMLIESSNNIADTVVINAFGSLDAYLEVASEKAEELGLENSTFADVTGFSPNSKATASDLIVLADYAMRNPLFSEIVSTWQKTILGDIELTNTNAFLDFEGNGVIGIKSGLTDTAGGTFLTAAKYQLDSGDTVVSLAVTLGAETHFSAQEAAMPLLRAVQSAFEN